MRMLASAAGAALLVLLAAPAAAGDPRGGSSCHGCGYPPPPPPHCCHDGHVVYFDGHASDGGYIGRRVHYAPAEPLAPACPSASFGYVASGFGRADPGPSWCGYRQDGYDRGGRYGYSRRHESRARESWEVRESWEAHGAWEEGYLIRDDGWRRDCDCRGDRPPAPYPPPYLPEPPRYEPPRHERPRSHRPARPRRSHPPRQEYRQEPGERG